MPFKAARCALVSMTLAGFSLPGSARASSGSSSSGSSSSGSSSSGSSSSGSSGSATASTALISVVSTVAGAVVVYAVVRANRRGKGDWGEDWDSRERARALLDSGIIDTRSNLAVELGVVMSNPDTFEQMNINVAERGGATLGALSEAAFLPPQVVAGHWSDTRSSFGTVETETDADHFSKLFMSRLARDITVDPTLASGMLWELARERAQPNFPAEADTHRWLASWMDIPIGSAILATDFGFADNGDRLQADLRSRIYADPSRFLDRISTDIGIRHPKEVDRRVRGLVAGMRPWWPTDDPIPEVQDAQPTDMTGPEQPTQELDPSDKPEPVGTP